jgi:glucokinase
MILAGDIGAAQIHLALFNPEKGSDLKPLEKRTFTTSSKCFEEVVDSYWSDIQVKEQLNGRSINAACFGIAGPVIGNRCKMPHLGWVIKVKDLRGQLGCMAIKLINDLEAMAHGIDAILDEKKELDVLNSGMSSEGNRALIVTTGKGLGEMQLELKRDKTFHPIPSEGGHATATFPPSAQDAIDLLLYLRKRKDFSGDISSEQVLSWSGLEKIYQFVRDKNLSEDAKVSGEEDKVSADVIINAALANNDELSTKALNLLVSLYGAEAGNLALRNFAVGGVYVGGELALQIDLTRHKETFMNAFKAKEGQFAEQNSQTPVKVIRNPEIGLLGAAYYAKEYLT